MLYTRIIIIDSRGARVYYLCHYELTAKQCSTVAACTPYNGRIGRARYGTVFSRGNDGLAWLDHYFLQSVIACSISAPFAGAYTASDNARAKRGLATRD